MLFSIISKDVKNSLPLRKKVRDKHLARLKNLAQQGRLIIAGPHPAIESDEPGEFGFTGSLVVAEFDCLDDAKKWADSDPYLIEGVYLSVTVQPFKKVLP